MEGYGTGGDRGHPRRERQTSVMLSERRVHQVVMLTILSAPFVTCAYWDCASYECARHFFNAFREGGGVKTRFMTRGLKVVVHSYSPIADGWPEE